MCILTKYFCKEFFRLFFLCLIVFLAIYLTIDFIQKIDNFIEANAPKTAIIAYFFFKTPHIMVQMVPVAVLISVVVMFSIMNKNNEITALKASGVSIFKASLPIVLSSLGMAIALFLFSELLVPYTSSISQGIYNKEVKKRDQKRFYGRGNIWYRGNNCIYWIRNFNGKHMVMDGPTFYFFDDSFHLIKRIQGRRAVWAGDRWRVEKGVIQVVTDRGDYDFNTFEKMDLKLPEGPETFLKSVKRPEEMSYWQLKRFAECVRLEGYDATKYLVEMNIKLAFPLISFIMVLIGIPITLGLKKGGTPLAVSLGMCVCFLYLLNLGLARSFGLAGLLPPVLSAWLANFVFFLSGSYLMMHLKT